MSRANATQSEPKPPYTNVQDSQKLHIATAARRLVRMKRLKQS